MEHLPFGPLAPEKKFEVSIKLCERRLKIKVNGLLHLYVNEGPLVGVQSWLEGNSKSSYWIEYTFESGATVKSEYVEKARWSAILEKLDEVL